MNKTIIIAVITLALGLGAGYWLAGKQQGQGLDGATEGAAKGERKVLFYRNPMNPAITSPTPAKDDMGMDYIPVYAGESKPKEKKILFYRNPMNPAITSPTPAKDDMGMDYIPVYAEGGSDKNEPAGTVTIDPVTVQDIGVRTARVIQRPLSREIHAVARVTYDEERLARLHPKTEGWIDELYVDKTGEPVAKDTILLSFYSPQLVSSQQEYLLALKNEESLKDSPFDDIRKGARELVISSRERLELLDVPEHQIIDLEVTRKIKKNLHIHTPFDGIVMKVGVRDGQYVTPTTELYMLADLRKIWVYVDIYENELPWVKLGDTAEMTVEAIPGKVFTGKVTFIYPYMESKTRTNRIRLEFDNYDLKLKPEMYAMVTLKASRQVDAVVVPSEAIVRSGLSNQVFVVRAPGKFEPRKVTLGVSAEGLTQILSGVKPGEEVVTSSQFLIDSESKLREATAKMMEVLSAQSDKKTAGKMNDMQK
ncbi:MAG TPA: efflux RND transporter periplasmic adaptor subunit [Gammaproteobacteria bacterium]|nr:efflux RND transporter periplasmic adaptor subunit [Gammaproteobacteria bacterium]